MVSISCVDNHCPYQYYCDVAKLDCIHNPVFPPTLYPIIIYCLFPFASAICNTSGNSFGEFKVLFLMDLLDYTESGATVITYPLTVGTALFNFITLIFRRHPTNPTSLVDFNIVMIIIPSVLYGSTIGAIVNKYIPPIIADSLIIFILAAFSIKFFLRFLNFRKEAGENASKQIEFTEVDDKQSKNRASNLGRQFLNDSQMRESKRQRTLQAQKQIQVVRPNQFQIELQEQLRYQQTYHIPHIFATCCIFAVFQTLSFLAQGKIVPFTICSEYYPIGMSILSVVFLSFLVFMYYYTRDRMAYYRKIQYHYQYPLDSIKYYVLIVLSAFLGGFNGGVFGVGSSTTMIFSLLYLQIEPIVVSATVGYQVIFGGLGSLCQAFATNQITIEVAGFFFGITFILGGALSYLSLRIVRTLNQNKTNQVLMLIVSLLTGFSTLALIANIVISYEHFGATYMISSPFQC